MLRTFFSRRIHWAFAFIFLGFFLFLEWEFLFLALGFYLFVRYLFRREALSQKGPAPTAPLSGTVLSYTPEKHALTMKMNWWQGFGCYLPIGGEIVERSSEGIKIRDAEGLLWGMDFYPGIWGFLPQIFVLPGDLGQSGGNLGFISGGGTVILYLPENYEILVQVNDELVMGQTQLAKRKSNYE